VIYTTILSNKLTSNLMPDVAITLIKPGVAPDSLSGVLEALLTGDTASKAIAALTTIQLMIAAKGNANSYPGVLKLCILLLSLSVQLDYSLCLLYVILIILIAKKIDIRLEEGSIVKAHIDTGAGHIIHRNERTA
jgi:hypothetical protein